MHEDFCIVQILYKFEPEKLTSLDIMEVQMMNPLNPSKHKREQHGIEGLKGNITALFIEGFKGAVTVPPLGCDTPASQTGCEVFPSLDRALQFANARRFNFITLGDNQIGNIAPPGNAKTSLVGIAKHPPWDWQNIHQK